VEERRALGRVLLLLLLQLLLLLLLLIRLHLLQGGGGAGGGGVGGGGGGGPPARLVGVRWRRRRRGPGVLGVWREWGWKTIAQHWWCWDGWRRRWRRGRGVPVHGGGGGGGGGIARQPLHLDRGGGEGNVEENDGVVCV